MMIPFNKPFLAKNTMRYLEEVMHGGKLSGDGSFTRRVREFMNKNFQPMASLLTTSGSSALDMAAILMDLQEGDEVILPSYTFVSTANSPLLRNAKIVFADIDESTLNISPIEISNRVTARTKAIIPVHYAGVACEMNAIMSIARDNQLLVVEDAAQGVNAKYNGQYLGTIGDLGCYSFHETKNYSCGEGGALLINHNPELAARAEIVREKGTNRSQFYRGEVDKYTWVDVGSSFLSSDILAAILLAQFEHLDEIQQLRKKVYQSYMTGLKEEADKGIICLPIIPDNCESNYHMFYILLPSEALRDHALIELKKIGIASAFHYVPLHSSPMGLKMGYKKGDFPVTERISSTLLRLPMYPGLTEIEQEYIIDRLKLILNNL